MCRPAGVCKSMQSAVSVYVRVRPAATCAADTHTDDRWLQLLTNKPAAGPAPPVSLPGAHLLNRASRCSLRLCSAVWASTTEDSKRTALLVSIVDPLQSVTAPNESPLTAKRNIRTRTALISSSSCGQKQTVDMLTRQEEATQSETNTFVLFLDSITVLV